MKNIEFTKEELSLIRMALISTDYYNQNEYEKECRFILINEEQVINLKEKFGFPTK